MTPRPSSSSRGFTLIELLTVIAIIGVLAGILIPVVGSVRQSANAVRCSSNLRQIAIGALTYSGDNKSIILPWRPPAGSAYWMTTLAPYVGVKRPNSPAIVEDSVFMCPTEKPNSKDEPYYTEDRIRTRYSINLHIAWDGALNPSISRSVRYNQLENPARTYLFIDLFGSGGGGSWMSSNLVYPHKDRVNVAFTDGHVEAKTREQMAHYCASFDHIFWKGYNWSGSSTFKVD